MANVKAEFSNQKESNVITRVHAIKYLTYAHHIFLFFVLCLAQNFFSPEGFSNLFPYIATASLMVPKRKEKTEKLARKLIM